MTQVIVNMGIIAEKCIIKMSAKFRIATEIVSQDTQHLARMDKFVDYFPKKHVLTIMLLLLIMIKKIMILRNKKNDNNISKVKHLEDELKTEKAKMVKNDNIEILVVILEMTLKS